MSDKLYSLEELVDMGDMPAIMLEDFDVPCSCGKPMLANRSLTRYVCSDPKCIYHMAMRAVYLADKLGLGGYGKSTCINIIRDYNLQDHIDILPIITDGRKPHLRLWEVADIACIPGYATKLEDMFSGFNSFEEYFRDPWCNDDILEHKDRLLKLESYCIIEKPLSEDKLEVMISGEICTEGFENAFPTKESFVAACNKYIGDVFEVVARGPGQDRAVLICDEADINTGTTGKWKAARKALANGKNMKIMTSLQFLLWLHGVRKKYDTEGHI